MLTFDSCIMNVNVNSTTRTELQPNFLSISFGPLPNKRYLAKKLDCPKILIQRKILFTEIIIRRKFWCTENLHAPKFRYVENSHIPKNPITRNSNYLYSMEDTVDLPKNSINNFCSLLEINDGSKIAFRLKNDLFGIRRNVFFSDKGFILSKNILCYPRPNHLQWFKT